MAKVSILVYVGDPLDYAKLRHTGIFIHFDDEPANEGTMFHITGTLGLFEFDERKEYDPMKSTKLRKTIEIGDIVASKPAVRSILAATRVRNGVNDADWNCQNWVGDALQQLVNQGWITKEQRDVAVDKMVEACLEAQDDEE